MDYYGDILDSRLAVLAGEQIPDYEFDTAGSRMLIKSSLEIFEFT